MSKYTVANAIWKDGLGYVWLSLFGFTMTATIVGLNEIYPEHISLYGAVAAATMAMTHGYFAYDRFRRAFDELYDKGA